MCCSCTLAQFYLFVHIVCPLTYRYCHFIRLTTIKIKQQQLNNQIHYINLLFIFVNNKSLVTGNRNNTEIFLYSWRALLFPAAWRPSVWLWLRCWCGQVWDVVYQAQLVDCCVWTVRVTVRIYCQNFATRDVTEDSRFASTDWAETSCYVSMRISVSGAVNVAENLWRVTDE